MFQVIDVRYTALRQPVPYAFSSGEETQRVELGLRLWNVQHILVGDASQSSSSAKLFEGYDHLVSSSEHLP